MHRERDKAWTVRHHSSVTVVVVVGVVVVCQTSCFLIALYDTFRENLEQRKLVGDKKAKQKKTTKKNGGGGGGGQRRLMSGYMYVYRLQMYALCFLKVYVSMDVLYMYIFVSMYLYACIYIGMQTLCTCVN